MITVVLPPSGSVQVYDWTKKLFGLFESNLSATVTDGDSNGETSFTFSTVISTGT